MARAPERRLHRLVRQLADGDFDLAEVLENDLDENFVVDRGLRGQGGLDLHLGGDGGEQDRAAEVPPERLPVVFDRRTGERVSK